MKIRTKILAFSLALMLIASFFVLNSSAEDGQVLIDLSTTWRYLDDGTDPGAGLTSLTDWTKPGFNDSSWKSAAGKFGSKNGTLGTISGCEAPTVLIDLYANDGNTHPTYFFRTTFTVDNLSSIGALSFDMLADDATVVYINGKMVSDSRSSIPSSASSANLYYANHTSADKSFWLDSVQAASVLVEGINTIAVELHNNQNASSDIYFALNSVTIVPAADALKFTDVSLTVGADESSRSITWHSSSSMQGMVYYAPVSEMTDGALPQTTKTATSTVFEAKNKPGYYSHKATLTGLNPDTDYVYRLSNEGKTSDLYYFSTDPTGDFEFVFVGDPQLSSATHSASWIDTLVKIKQSFGANLLISTGDQITTPDSEEQYGFLLVDELTGLTFAPTIGPSHDSSSPAFTDHFNLPNLSTEYGANETGANYWYTYNGTLFMHLNMSDTSAATNGEHKAFMQEAIAANPNAKWKIAIIHNALYSTGSHSDPNYKYFESEIGKYRQTLAPMLTELGIDIVLSGHDHIYVRSHIMNGDTPADYVVENGYINEPAGTLHIAASSSSGSKFYDSTIENGYYVAVENAEKRKSAIHFTVTDTSITFSAYFLDDMSVFDTLSIYKTPHAHTPKSIDAKTPTCEKKGNSQYWQCTECKAYFADEECTTVTTPEAQLIDALGHDYNDATCSAPKTCQRDGCDKTLGKPKDHSWLEPTCTAPYVCEKCGATDGEPLGHKYANDCATTCTRCKEERTPNPHTDSDGDRLCDACGAEVEVKSDPIVLMIVISAALTASAAAAATVILVKRKKSK